MDAIAMWLGILQLVIPPALFIWVPVLRLSRLAVSRVYRAHFTPVEVGTVQAARRADARRRNDKLECSSRLPAYGYISIGVTLHVDQ